jgi:hypothetical protein
MAPMRRAILYSLSSILFLVPGCVKNTAPVALVDRSPLIIDEAMQQRNWSRTVVRFQNGETPSWATGFLLEHPADGWADVSGERGVAAGGLRFDPAVGAGDIPPGSCRAEFYGHSAVAAEAVMKIVNEE